MEDPRGPSPNLDSWEECLALVEAFYRNVEQEPGLRAMYPRSLRCATNSLAAFLFRISGGKPNWRKRPVIETHTHFTIDLDARDTWMRCMAAAIDEVVAEDATKEVLLRFFAETANQLVNTGPRVPSNYGAIGAEPTCVFEAAWSEVQTIECAHAAARTGDLTRLAELRSLPLPELLLEAAEHDQKETIDWLLKRGADPSGLAISGKLLVSRPEAAKMLLEAGASVNGQEGQEPPLIRSSRGDRRADIEEVRALLRHGADVNAQGRLGRTALHYAARSGNCELADLLLQGGAAAEAIDAKKLTPLDHAVARKKLAMQQLLRPYSSPV